MSTLIALRSWDAHTVVIGSDSLVAHGDQRLRGGVAKWLVGGDCAVGVAGALVTLDILRPRLSDVLASRPELDVLRKIIAGALKDADVKPHYEDDAGAPLWHDGRLFYVRPPEAWSLDGELCASAVDDFDAIGSGASYAMGALTVFRSGPRRPEGETQAEEDHVAGALRVACLCDMWTGGALNVQRLGDPPDPPPTEAP